MSHKLYKHNNSTKLNKQHVLAFLQIHGQHLNLIRDDTLAVLWAVASQVHQNSLVFRENVMGSLSSSSVTIPRRADEELKKILQFSDTFGVFSNYSAVSFFESFPGQKKRGQHKPAQAAQSAG